MSPATAMKGSLPKSGSARTMPPRVSSASSAVNPSIDQRSFTPQLRPSRWLPRLPSCAPSRRESRRTWVAPARARPVSAGGSGSPRPGRRARRAAAHPGTKNVPSEKGMSMTAKPGHCSPVFRPRSCAAAETWHPARRRAPRGGLPERHRARSLGSLRRQTGLLVPILEPLGQVWPPSACTS